MSADITTAGTSDLTDGKIIAYDHTQEYKPEAIQLEYGQTDPAHKVEFIGRQLGTLQAFDDQGRVFLNPQPSNSGDDPLNFSIGYKRFIAALACTAVLCCNMTGAGPTIAIIQQVIEFVGAPNTANITKTAYLFNSTALLQGVGLFVWVPAISICGRRPAYIACLTLYLASLVWVALAKTYTVELIGRIVLGFATGAGECLGALIVTDMYYAHERGLYMAFYNVFLSCGAAVGMIIAGPITQHAPSWRYIYYVNIAIIGSLLIVVFLFFPETSFDRNQLILNGQSGPQFVDEIGQRPVAPPTKTYSENLRLYTGRHTRESYWRMAARPFGLVFLPAVMFSVLAFSATIGFLVAVVSNVSPAFQNYLGFTPQSVGLLFFGAIIGSLIGIPAGGWLGDKCVEWGAKRNNGVREPEHRLPAMIVPIITGPLSLILYGLCIDKQTHWFVGCLGVSLVNFNVCAATNITMVYTIDCYKPIADEVVTTTLAFKAIVGFALGFYTNTWVADQGYLAGYGEMAAIEGGLLLLALPMWYWGKRLRSWSAGWRWLQWAVQWRDDRDDLKAE